MKVSKKQYPNPGFGTAEEEAAFWREHSPLVEGYEGRVQRKRQKRSSYLALRLSGEELDTLRDAAEKAGVGPTTLARNLILKGLDEESGLLRRIEVLEREVAGLRR